MTSSPFDDPATRIAEIRQENAGGDVSSADITWLCDEVERLAAQLTEVRHAVVRAASIPSGKAARHIADALHALGLGYKLRPEDR